MRDIRADLKERLEIAEAEFKRLDDLAEAAQDRMLSIKEMLEAEEMRVAAGSMPSIEEITAKIMSGQIPAFANGAAAPPAPLIALDEFLLKAVRRGVGDKGELRDAAVRAGYFHGSTNSPGRVVHAKLTNLVRDGQLAKTGDAYVMGGN